MQDHKSFRRRNGPTDSEQYNRGSSWHSHKVVDARESWTLRTVAQGPAGQATLLAQDSLNKFLW